MVMKTYRIPLLWQMFGYVDVEAESPEAAMEYAIGPDCPLPEGYYVEDSVQVDTDILPFENDDE